MRSPTSARRTANVLALIMAFAVAVTACGSGEPASVGTSPTTTPVTAPTTSTPPATQAPTTDLSAPPTTPSTTPTTTPTTTSTVTTTTTQPPATTSSVTTTTLHGVVVDYGPAAGDVLAVVGVAHDDVLNVRAGPGIDQTIVARLAPLATDVLAKGVTRQLTQSAWYQVEVDGVAGWVSSRYVAYMGTTDDITSYVVAELGGIPGADTMTELGLIVAESQASDDPASRIVISVAPTVGDLGEITYDVVGLGDDSVYGLRLHVFGAPDDDGFSLKSIESTLLCMRGVHDGICV